MSNELKPPPSALARTGAEQLRTALVMIGWTIVGLLILANILVLWGIGGGAVLALPFVLGLLCMTALRIAFTGYRRRRADVVLGHVAMAVDLEFPLPQYLRIARTNATRPIQQRLSKMLAALESGASLSRALNRGAGELPLVLQEQVAAAESAGTLHETLPILLAQETRDTLHAVRARADATYAFVLATTAILIVSMISIFVLPKFYQILHDFRLPMPPSTAAVGIIAYLPEFIVYRGLLPLFSFGDGSPIVQAFIVVLMVVLVLFTFGFLASAARGLFTSRTKRSMFRWFSDRITWRLPVIGRLIRQRQAAAVCATLHDALQAGRPLPDAIALSTFPSLNVVFRNRLVRWRERLIAGEPPAIAARQSKLPRLLCDLLAGARNDLPGAVSFAGRAYASASERLAIVLRAIAPILVTFTFAIVVLSIALSLFEPILALIDSLSIRSRP